MPESQQVPLPELTPEQLRQIDTICEHFEEAWNADTKPQLEKYLADAPANLQPALLRELVLAEVERR